MPAAQQSRDVFIAPLIVFAGRFVPAASCACICFQTPSAELAAGPGSQSHGWGLNSPHPDGCRSFGCCKTQPWLQIKTAWGRGIPHNSTECPCIKMAVDTVPEIGICLLHRGCLHQETHCSTPDPLFSSLHSST